jgi:MFS family permease
VQADFGVDRASASIPYTLTMIGLGAGGVLMGRLSDRFGITVPAAIGAVALGLGYVASGYAENLWQFALAHGVLIAIGGSAVFGPVIADISHWFARRRGIAVALCACGNYLGGTIWPPVVQHLVETVGWRSAHIQIGLFCVVTMLPLAFALRRRAPHFALGAIQSVPRATPASLGFSPRALQILLAVAGVACCVAMSMPQVHIVAYCGDLGYGVARGAQMLSLMLGFGIISRVASGFVADRIGGLGMMLLSSVLQTSALLLYFSFDSLPSLYVISALFGLFQGGLIPSYAIAVREYFPAREAGTRVGILIMATLFGMAFGGWISGAIFDFTGSYRAAFANGALWNVLNAGIAFLLLLRIGRRLAPA